MMWKRVYALRRVKAIPIQKKGVATAFKGHRQQSNWIGRRRADQLTRNNRHLLASKMALHDVAISKGRAGAVCFCATIIFGYDRRSVTALYRSTYDTHTHNQDGTGSLQTEHSPNNNKKTHKAQNTEVAHCEQFVVSCFMGDKQWPHIVNGWDGSQLAAISSSYGA